MTLPIVLLIGSSGNVGEATLKSLSGHSSQVNIRAGVRDPSKADKLKSIPHVEIVQADPSKKDQLTNALKGVDRAFFITAGSKNREELAVNTIDAAKAAGVKYLLVVSVLTAELTGTVFGQQFTPIEKYLKESGLQYGLLRLPLFIDNNFAHVQSIKSQGVFYGPGQSDKKFTPIAVADIGKAAAAILIDPSKHINKTYKLTTTPFSQDDVAAAFTAALGKPVKYIQVPYDAAQKSFLSAGFEDWQVTGILELLNLIDGLSGVTNDPSNDFKTITKEEPTTIAQWVDSVKGAFQ